MDKFRRVMFGEYDGITRLSRYYNAEKSNPRNKFLKVPPLRKGRSSDLKIDDSRDVYRDIYGGNFKGLHEAIKTSVGTIKKRPVYIFDNHNHALFAWTEAFLKGKIKPGATLFHFDAHPDNGKPLDMGYNPNNLRDAYNYTMYRDINEFIYPAMQSGLIKDFIWVRASHSAKAHERTYVESDTQFAIRHYGMEAPVVQQLLAGEFDPASIIVDWDVDYFQDFVDNPHLIRVTRSENIAAVRNADYQNIRTAIHRAGVTTIATSPGYIDQAYAIQLVQGIV